MSDLEILKRTVLAPWIFKGTALIGKPRKLGGNQFRHNMATLAILIDYHMVDSVLLKAAVIHDLLEDIPDTDLNDLLYVDEEAPEVGKLDQEVSRHEGEPKEKFLTRIIRSGSYRAKILKCADRISNVTDLHYGIFEIDRMVRYLDETEKYIVPLAAEVNPNMFVELTDLISKRRKMLRRIVEMESCTTNFLN